MPSTFIHYGVTVVYVSLRSENKHNNKGTGPFNGRSVELVLEAQQFRFEAPTIGIDV